MRIEPDKWLEEYEASLAEGHEPTMGEAERESVLRILGFLADMEPEHQAEAMRCAMVTAIRGCRSFYRSLWHFDSWIESAELGANPDFVEAMRQDSAKTYEQIFAEEKI